MKKLQYHCDMNCLWKDACIIWSQSTSVLFRWGRTFPGRVQLLNKCSIHCTGWTSVMFCANVLFERTCALFSKESGKSLHLCICPFATARWRTHTHTISQKKQMLYAGNNLACIIHQSRMMKPVQRKTPTIPKLVNMITPNAMLPQLPRSWTSCQMPFQCSCLVFSVKLVTFQTRLHTPHLI